MKQLLLITLGFAFAVSAIAEQAVIRDGGVSMSRAELEYVVRNWSPDMQEAAARDTGDRFELLNMVLANKKIAAEASKLTPADGDLYWQKEITERTVMRRFVVDNYLRKAEVPDMSKLALERYHTLKDRYASMPEQRLSSHILIKCDTEDCDHDAAQSKAEGLLKRIKEGEDFGDLAREFSDDTRSGAAGGLYDRWLARKNKEVAPEYIDVVYKLEAAGDISEVEPSRFGYHIVRLDEIKPAHYRSFEDSQAAIEADLVQEYMKLNAKAFDAKYKITDKAFIDGPAMDEIFEQYKRAEFVAPQKQPQPQPPVK